MSSSPRYRIYTDPKLRDSLIERFGDFPLKELLEEMGNRLSKDFNLGKPAPFPYAEGVRIQSFSIFEKANRYKVSAVYEVDPHDHIINLLDVGIRPDW